ncbi:conserved hypothetical protein [Trichinella spiralis]|uniref:hypothetical protein n=1 Tax=Trichinella spiralis TaxID=6334 RepID=UPI0001EFE0CA|nr:conserved hypothetical protein [Trichinella spiralis]
MVEQVECGRLSPGWILPIGSVLSELQQLAVQLVYDDLDRGTGGGLQHRTNEANHLLGFTVPGAVQHLDNHCYGCQRNWRLQHDRKLLLRRYGSQLDRHGIVVCRTGNCDHGLQYCHLLQSLFSCQRICRPERW